MEAIERTEAGGQIVTGFRVGFTVVELLEGFGARVISPEVTNRQRADRVLAENRLHAARYNTGKRYAVVEVNLIEVP